jgi:SAM-dependent methyltransferase
LRQFADRTERAILNTDSTGALHKILRKSRNYIVSEYAPGVASGTRIRGGLYQDLEHTSFPDRSFDLVITEDVLEHVADPVQACREIKRILRPGGSQVATISVLESQPHSVVRSRRENGSIIHLLPPVYHSDPLRPEGALVFVDFGADVIDRYFSLTGKTEVFWSYRNAEDEQKYAIYHNAVYLSRKT